MRIFLTPGDPEGIGPEITIKALRSERARAWRKSGVHIVCIGAAKPFRRSRMRAGFELIAAPPALPGYQAGWSIERATRLVLESQRAGVRSALVTGPINKARIQDAGFRYPGHTEMLADLCGVKGEVTMMLANDQLRISLVTTHIALKDVSRALTPEKIQRAVLHTVTHLHEAQKIRRPRIAVAGLNPHAGEDGRFGDEEARVILPALRALAKRRIAADIHGPLPADTLFAKNRSAPKGERYDAVVCLYHDQGLIPVKLLDFQRTVNVTLGLPIVRTSVDHGTAFDIAGQGIADPSSLISAIDLAIQILKRRGAK